jgi:hypothetical protein
VHLADRGGGERREREAPEAGRPLVTPGPLEDRGHLAERHRVGLLAQHGEDPGQLRRQELAGLHRQQLADLHGRPAHVR